MVILNYTRMTLNPQFANLSHQVQIRTWEPKLLSQSGLHLQYAWSALSNCGYLWIQFYGFGFHFWTYCTPLSHNTLPCVWDRNTLELDILMAQFFLCSSPDIHSLAVVCPSYAYGPWWEQSSFSPWSLSASKCTSARATEESVCISINDYCMRSYWPRFQVIDWYSCSSWLSFQSHCSCFVLCAHPSHKWHFVQGRVGNWTRGRSVFHYLIDHSHSWLHHYIRQRREYHIYKQLLQMVPGLEERLMNSSEEEIFHIADLVHCYISIHCSYFPISLLTPRCLDPKRIFQCLVCWHEEPQGCNPWLDHT
jgi:hypothetical protein